ncbi:MAG TPA: methyltransferase domain-containing protein [Sedimentisphaerales bacterium]|nr:methyltransferase domain-containing protein [Sedimentisphaerales bacterium]HRS10592.1 methyltransferase domain-containing protein [Sedimentisphaerales bacterium]HRV47184.1 methyltransferase domain-containing protein [Sedimentisphaerales bacterium]
MDTRPVTSRAAVLGWVGAFLLLFVLLGAGVSAWWIGMLDGPGAVLDRLGAVVAGLGLTVLMTAANVSVRWVRWHFLLRSVDIRLKAEDGLQIYLVTLPAILTPFYVGELLRVPLVGRTHRSYRTDVVYIWLLERLTDLLALSLFAMLAGRFRIYGPAIIVVWVIGLLMVRRRFQVQRLRNWPRLFHAAVALGLTVLAWAPVGLALSSTLSLMRSPLPFVEALGTFAHTTVLGGLTGIPVGIGVAGSLLVRELVASDVALSAAILSTVAFRLGTVWFIVAVGSITLLLRWKPLLGRLRSRRPDDHFEDIAETYEHRIPEHVRQRLLLRKVRYMQETLSASGLNRGARGLDIGCGHGWYACEMARQGHQMVGVDRSPAQIRMAQRYAQEQHVECRFLTVDAAKLPFDDGHFDFAYAINVLHHVVDPQMQLQVLEEIVRVLKPGGVFFLQEINTMNPLFRFYLGYVFPLIRGIDEGNERWIRPDRLPDLAGADWMADKLYFTFLPDFIPAALLQPLAGFERYLETSRLRKGSAHYVATLVKRPVENSK